jgi:hypothetical protein
MMSNKRTNPLHRVVPATKQPADNTHVMPAPAFAKNSAHTTRIKRFPARNSHPGHTSYSSHRPTNPHPATKNKRGTEYKGHPFYLLSTKTLGGRIINSSLMQVQQDSSLMQVQQYSEWKCSQQLESIFKSTK